MKISKKLVAGVSAFMLVVSSAAITASAVTVDETSDANLTISASTKDTKVSKVSKGDKVTVTVDLENVPETGIAGFEFAVSYDATALQFESIVENKDVTGNASDVELESVAELKDTMVNEGSDYSCFDYSTANAGKIACMWATGLESNEYWINSDGTLATITFVALEDVDTSDASLGIAPILEDGEVVFAITDENGNYAAYEGLKVEETINVDGGENTETTTESGEVTTTDDLNPGDSDGKETTVTTESGEEVTTTDNANPGDSDSSVVLGDATLDGKVLVNDLLAIKKHVLKISTLEGQALINSDINKDGKVLVNDLLWVKKYVLKIITSFDGI